MAVELKIPEVGESVSEAYIQSWIKSEGDYAEKDEPVAELETEKISFELPAPVSGTVTRVLRKQGETVNVGDVIGVMEEGEAAETKQREPTKKSEEAGKKKARKKPEKKEAETERERPQEEERAPAEAEAARRPPERPRGAAEPAQRGREAGVAVWPRIMPAAQRALAEHGLRADEVEATGPGGRLLKEDVIRHLEEEAEGREGTERAAAAPARAPSETDREEEPIPMSPMRRTIARRLVEAQQTAALLTTFNEADMSAVAQLRSQYRDAFEKKYKVRLGFMSFFVKAAVDALKQFPELNSEIRGDRIVYRNYYDIGIAISTDKGLAVPVLRNAEQLSFAEIELAINAFADRARSNKLELKDLEGGTFTITNGGVFGSLMSTPIVNPPQSGVLGMHAIQDRPVARDGQVVIRPMMYLALTYDHRIVDGREAVTFLRRIREAVEQPARMLLEV